MYKAGDWVKIRTDLKEGNDYEIYCNSAMVNFARSVGFRGKLIKAVKSYGGIAFHIEGNQEWWLFTPRMFECNLSSLERAATIKTFCKNCKIRGTCKINERNKRKRKDLEVCELVGSCIELATKLGEKEFPHKPPIKE